MKEFLGNSSTGRCAEEAGNWGPAVCMLNKCWMLDPFDFSLVIYCRLLQRGRCKIRKCGTEKATLLDFSHYKRRSARRPTAVCQGQTRARKNKINGQSEKRDGFPLPLSSFGLRVALINCRFQVSSFDLQSRASKENEIYISSKL